MRHVKVSEKCHTQHDTSVFVFKSRADIKAGPLWLDQIDPVVSSHDLSHLCCAVARRFWHAESSEGWKAFGDHKGSRRVPSARPTQRRVCRGGLLSLHTFACKAVCMWWRAEPEGNVLQRSSPSQKLEFLSCHGGCCPGPDKALSGSRSIYVETPTDSR